MSLIIVVSTTTHVSPLYPIIPGYRIAAGVGIGGSTLVVNPHFTNISFKNLRVVVTSAVYPPRHPHVHPKHTQRMQSNRPRTKTVTHSMDTKVTLNIDVAVNTFSDVPNIIVVFHGWFLLPDPLGDAPMSIGDYHPNVDSMLFKVVQTAFEAFRLHPVAVFYVAYSNNSNIPNNWYSSRNQFLLPLDNYEKTIIIYSILYYRYNIITFANWLPENSNAALVATFPTYNLPNIGWLAHVLSKWHNVYVCTTLTAVPFTE